MIYLIKLIIKALPIIIIALCISLYSKASNLEYTPDIAVIAEDILLSEAEVVKDLKLRLNEVIAKNQSELSTVEKELKNLENNLKEKKNNLPKNNIALTKSFESELLEFNRLLKFTQEDFRARKAKVEKLQKESMKKIRDEISLILIEMSKELGFKFVIPSHQLIWFSPKADITKEVLIRTNKKIKRLELKF